MGAPSALFLLEVGFWALRIWLVPLVKFDGFPANLAQLVGENSCGSFRTGAECVVRVHSSGGGPRSPVVRLAPTL